MEHFLQTETLIIELLLIASIVAVVVQRLRVPYTVALVLVGLLFTLQSSAKIGPAPELILVIFVPPLVFEAAFHLHLDALRHNWRAIGTLAVPGVVLTMAVVGLVVSLGTDLTLPVALLFGATMAATDPVAVVALFKSLGTPKRLSVLVEGESLFNDGTAIVVFKLMLAVVITGHFDTLTSLRDFGVVAVGGLLVGSVLGWLVSLAIARIDAYLIETTLSTVLAFGSYLLAERLHVSGVLAVVAAGVLNGNLGPRGMSPTTRIALFNFWEYLAFVANSLVFLLIGLELDVPRLLAHWESIAIAIVAVVVSRVIVVYGFAWLGTGQRTRLPMSYRHVLFWGGLRGAVSLALVLSLPIDIGDRELLTVMAFGVVLFTLLVQGTTMQFLLKALGFVQHSAEELAYQRLRGRLLAVQAEQTWLQRLHDQGTVTSHVWETLAPQLAAQVQELRGAMSGMLQAQPTLQATEVEYARREGLRAQRSAVAALFRDGVLSESVHDELLGEIDTALEQEPPQAPGLDEDTNQVVPDSR